MKLIFVTEARFTKDSNGSFYGDASFNYKLWIRYLTCFSEVMIMARVNYDEKYIGDHCYLASGPNVSFIELPIFIGPLQYLKKRTQVVVKIKESIDSVDGVFICRIPGTIGDLAIQHLYKSKRPFGVEVVGDPWDVFAPGTIKHFFRRYFRWSGYFNLRKNVANASAVLYVTEKKLQQRYPAGTSAFQTTASNVKIEDALIRSNPPKHVVKQNYIILSVGSLEQMYKAPDVVLSAIKILHNQGVHCSLIWLGDGRYKLPMQNFAIELGIEDRVDFKGSVNTEEVRAHLMSADVFVLVSRAEGLPRAIIEAMAVGLPCIGTNVGGIPELLDESALISKNKPNALAIKIKNLIKAPSYYNDQATRNLLESSKYKGSLLHKKRQIFYDYLISLND